MKGLGLPLFLQVIGIGIIIAEIILPSGGLLSLFASIVIGYSLYIVFSEFGQSVGFVFVGADVIMIPVLVIVGLKMLAKSPVTLSSELKSSEGVVSQSPELEHYLDMEGVALTNLRPAGTAMLAQKRVDVVSRGEFIDKDARVTVIAVTGNQVVVKEVNS